MKTGKERIYKGKGFTLYHQNLPKKKLSTHAHPEAHLFIPLEGSLEVEVRGQSYEMGFGKMMFLGGSVPHSFSATGESGERMIVQFDERLNRSFRKASKQVAILPIHPLIKDLALDLFTYSEEAFSSSVVSLLLEVLVDALEKQTRDSGNLLFKTQELILKSSRPQFKELLKLMEADLDLQLPDLGERVGASPRTLTRLVQAEVGMSPKELYTFFRVQRACDLIYRGELSLTAIAFECGYGSLSQFILNFKKWTGQKPSEFKPSH